jgi:ANTAR domain-containing protein
LNVTEGDWSRDKAEFVVRPSTAPHPANDLTGSPLAQEFAQLARLLFDAETVADVLDHVVNAAAAIIPHAELVSMTLRSADGQLHTPVKTAPVGNELDALQYSLAEGPCYDAARLPGLAFTHSPDLADEPKWPQFGPKAAQRGFASVLSTALLPDVTPPRLSGALNVYSPRRDMFADETTRDLAFLLATHASVAMANTEAVRLAELRQTQFRRALDSRDVIGQAKGILMNRRGIDADAAFDLLRKTSQDLNIKLATLADTLARRHTELDVPQT